MSIMIRLARITLLVLLLVASALPAADTQAPALVSTEGGRAAGLVAGVPAAAGLVSTAGPQRLAVPGQAAPPSGILHAALPAALLSAGAVVRPALSSDLTLFSRRLLL